MKALRSIIALVFVIALSLMSVSPASAFPPFIDTGSFDGSFLVDPQPCVGIEVWDHEIYKYKAITTLDKQGTPVFAQAHFIGTDNFYNPANPGVVLSGHFVDEYHVDLVTMAVVQTGIPVHINVPGYGAVNVQAGRWFADGRIVGKHSSIEPGGLDAFCAFLAGN